MHQHTIDYVSDTIESTRSAIIDALEQTALDHQSEREGWESDLADAVERAERAENALREVLDRLDDWHRGLCDRDEIITGKMIRELVSERFSIKSVRQEVRDWEGGNR